MEEEVKQKTSTGVNEAGEVVQTRSTEVNRSADDQTLVTNIVWFVYGLVAVFLGLRMVLKLLAANAGNGFVDFVYTVSGWFAAPFNTIFGVETAQTDSGNSVFEPSVLVAILVYALLAWGVVKLVNLNRQR